MTGQCFNYSSAVDIDKDASYIGVHNAYNKNKHGEVHTPCWFIESMLSLFPPSIWSDPTKRWLDTGAGHGRITLCIYYRLMKGLESFMSDALERHTYIISNMLYMIELNPDNVGILSTIFGDGANILCCDYLEKADISESISPHIIVGNPPFNVSGSKKVPTNTRDCKNTDGISVWNEFVHHTINSLDTGGIMLYITPCIWMKPDKAGLYDALTNDRMKLNYVQSYTSTETNSIFNGEAQTPTSVVYATKLDKADVMRTSQIIQVYDKCYSKFVQFRLYRDMPIPVNGASIISKLQYICDTYNIPSMRSLVTKTNMPPRAVVLSNSPTTDVMYPNIHSCVLTNNKATLVYKYSNIPCPFYGEEKLVLAHKMYGVPYYDEYGHYGISNRDSYIIRILDPENIVSAAVKRRIYMIYKQFLSTKFAICLCGFTTYRMKYLEKYVFEYIPQIHLIPDIPLDTFENTMLFLGMSPHEVDYVAQYSSRDYIQF